MTERMPSRREVEESARLFRVGDVAMTPQDESASHFADDRGER